MTERSARKLRAGSATGMAISPIGERRVLEEITCDRRRFLGVAAMTIAAAQLGMIGCAGSQSSNTDANKMTTPLPAQLESLFTHQTADVDGIRLHYVIGGQGFPVVLLHGWPETWYEWRKIMPSLAEKYTVIAPDSRGLGDSERTESGYDASTLAEDV